MGENRYIKNNPKLEINEIKTVQIGIVESIDDPNDLGRIKVRISGQANMGGDNGATTEELADAYPLIPKYFMTQPQVTEAVFVLTFTNQKSHSDRLYIGPIISQLNRSNLAFSPKNIFALNSFSFATTSPEKAISTIYPLKGVFPKSDDIAIQGRYNTDILLRKNEIQIRAGKFVVSQPNQNNPYDFQFNDTTQGFIQIKNDIPLTIAEGSTETNIKFENGSALNIVANKINLITYKDGSPRYKIFNNEHDVDDAEIFNFINTAHPLPFGDLLVEYLILLKNALLNHVHNNNGIPPTDLTIGETLPVKQFKDKAEDLENRMLSKNIHIN